MLTNDGLPDVQEKELLKSDISGWNEVYREIADEIGPENALRMFMLFHGLQVSFSNRLFSKEYIHNAIREKFNGNNISVLAQKYDYSERSIWRIIKSENIRRKENK